MSLFLDETLPVRKLATTWNSYQVFHIQLIGVSNWVWFALLQQYYQ